MLERRDGDADEADRAPIGGALVPEEVARRREDATRVIGRLIERALTRERLEGRKAKLQRDAAAAASRRAQPRGDRLGEVEERRLDARVVLLVHIEGALVSNGLRRLARDDDIRVEPLRAFPQRSAKRTEMGFELPHLETGEVADGAQPPGRERLARPRAHAPEAADVERREELGLAAARDDDESIGLAEIGCDLGAELVRCDADGEHEAEAFAHARL